MRKRCQNEPSGGHELSTLVTASNQPPETIALQPTGNFGPRLVDPSLVQCSQQARPRLQAEVSEGLDWAGPSGSQPSGSGVCNTIAGNRYDDNKSDSYQSHTPVYNYYEPNGRNPRWCLLDRIVSLILEAVR